MGNHSGPGEPLTPTAVVLASAPQAGQLALYEETFVAPVRRLNESLADVLDVDANPDRDPEEALALVREAVDRFTDETEDWLD